MGRLREEINRYQRIVAAVRESPGMEAGDLCARLKMNERTLFRYLEAGTGAVDLARILWDGQPLDAGRVAEYNRAIEKQASRDIGKSARLAKLAELLNQTTPSGGVTIRELTGKLQVTERTVYRDLCTLETEMGMGLVRPAEDPDSRGRYKLRFTYLPPLSPDRALFIYLSLLQQKGTVLGLNLPDVKQALLGTLAKYRYSPDDIALDQLEAKIHIVDDALADPELSGRHFIIILDALAKSYRLKVRYFTAYRQAVSERTVEPYGLICKHHNWYLVGRCREKDGLRTFRVDQIEALSPLKAKTFICPADFDLRLHCRDSWGVHRDGAAVTVRVKFAPDAAYRMKKMLYHPSQEIEGDLPDGSSLVRYRIDGKVEFYSWLLQWQERAEIIEPAEMRDEMRAIVRRVAAVYGE